MVLLAAGGEVEQRAHRRVLAVAALEQLSQRIAGKTVVCLVTGGSLSQERYYSEVRLPVLAPEYLSEAA